MLRISYYSLLVILFAGLSLQTLAQSPQWQQTNGPLGGDITSIAVINGNLFAGTNAGGVFLSTNNGQSWTPKNTGLSDLYVQALCAKGTDLYAGTVGHGVFKSTNNGTNWVLTGMNLQNITALTVIDNNIFTGGQSGEIYISVDDGLIWNKIITLPGSSYINALIATSGINLVAATRTGGSFRITYNNPNWTAATSGELQSYSGNCLAADNGKIYIGTKTMGVYSSTNGLNWNRCTTEPSNLDIQSLCVNGTNLYAGTNGGGVFISTNDGVSWNDQNMGLSNYIVKCLAVNGSYLFAGTYGDGIYRWLDSDGTWTHVNIGLTATTVNALITAGPGKIYAGTYGAGTFWAVNKGYSWGVGSEALEERYITALTYDDNYLYKATCDNIYRSSNGIIWTPMYSSSNIQALIAKGNFLFAGTSNGIILSTDHGQSWIDTISGLSSTDIRCLAINGSYIFAGTYGGGVFLSTNHGVSWTAVNSGLPSVSNTMVSSLLSEGTKLYVCFVNEGVYYTDNNGTNWNKCSNLPTSNWKEAMAVTANNIIVGTPDGAYVSTDNGVNWSQAGLTGLWINTLAIDGADLYAGTRSNGVWRISIPEITQYVQNPQNPQNPYNPGWTVFDTSKGMPGLIVYTIAIDTLGVGWLGTDAGLGKCNGNTWTNYTPANSDLPGYYIHTIAIDHQLNKWIGTDYALTKFDGLNWTSYTSSNSGLPYETVYSLCVDAQGTKWIGTDDGLASYNDVTWTTYNSSGTNPDISAASISAIAVDHQGNKWLGPWSLGMLKFNGTNWTVYDVTNSNLPRNYVKSIAIDVQDVIWSGDGYFGLTKFDGTNWTTYNESNSGLTNDIVNAVAIDAKGNKWVGTEGGLAKFDGTNWTMYYKTNSPLPSDSVISLAVDKYGNIWIGTYNGLAIFNSGEATDVKEYQKTLPLDIQLSQNYPNPFNPVTSIEYQLPKQGFVTLRIYDILGRTVATLVNQYKQPGNYTVEFNASNLASGIYFYQLKAQDFILTKKMMLLK